MRVKRAVCVADAVISACAKLLLLLLQDLRTMLRLSVQTDGCGIVC